jgi:hypothetical protein
MPRTTRSVNEISNLRHYLLLNSYPQGFTDPVINSKGSGCPNKKENPLGSVYIPYVKGVSVKFKHIGNQYNVRMIFRMKHTCRRLLMKTRPEGDPQQTAQCIYSIPCECGRSYIGKRSRPLALKVTAGVGNTGNRPTQFGYFSYVDPPYQQ